MRSFSTQDDASYLVVAVEERSAGLSGACVGTEITLEL